MRSQAAPEIVVICRSDIGMNKMTFQGNQTIKDFQEKLAASYSLPPDAIQSASIVGERNPFLGKYPPMTMLSKVPQFQDGAMIQVTVNRNAKPIQQVQKMDVEPQKQVIYTASGKLAKEDQLKQTDKGTHPTKDHALSIFCQHGPQAKCVNCLQDSKGMAKEEEKPKLNKCSHGPQGKCLNCTPFKEEKQTIKKAVKILCQHGPNGKCTHCIDENQIEAKHISFDQYLLDQKFKCKGLHPEEGKCNNCLPPTAISYKVKKDCKNHAPYPQAMCNNCMPPSILLKRQRYRHVDYVEFLNIPEMSNLVQFWSGKGKTEQRMGFLYGYYAEDPNYKNGVRAIIEAIYEPPQKGSFGGVELEQDKMEKDVNYIVAKLGLERVGWIFTSINHDCFLTSDEIRQAARYQQEHKVLHPSGACVSKFLTVVLRTKKDNPEEVLPEVYMVSDQGQQLEQDEVFTNSGRRKVLQVRQPKNEKDVLPSIICEGKTVTEFEPDFFIVNVAHGYNPGSTYNIMKLYEFPVENRGQAANTQTVKQFLHKHQKKPTYVRFADFHLLLYLSKMIDRDTAGRLAADVSQEAEVSPDLLDLIKHYTNQA